MKFPLVGFFRPMFTAYQDLSGECKSKQESQKTTSCGRSHGPKEGDPRTIERQVHEGVGRCWTISLDGNHQVGAVGIFVRETGVLAKNRVIFVTLPETNSSPLKMDGWNTTFLLGFGLFSGANC